MERKRGQRFGVLGVSVMLAACAPSVTQEIVELCNRDGGLKVYETAENVAGVYYGGSFTDGSSPINNVGEGCALACGAFITEYGYSFVEVGLFSREFLSNQNEFDLSNSFKRQLFFRYSLQDMGSPLCLRYRTSRKQLRVYGRHEFPDGVMIGDTFESNPKCIGLEEVDSVSARYGVYKTRYYLNPSVKNSGEIQGIWMWKDWVINLDNQKKMAEITFYANSYFPFGSPQHSFHFDSAWCPSKPQKIKFPEILKPLKS